MEKKNKNGGGHRMALPKIVILGYLRLGGRPAAKTTTQPSTSAPISPDACYVHAVASILSRYSAHTVFPWFYSSSPKLKDKNNHGTKQEGTKEVEVMVSICKTQWTESRQSLPQ
ncbi:hypothetical protein PIB30_000637 [Stylosanthes scabra]|uniref:Uncharacterized protein n=1 Tax=Stylosanthes scabra TaxID=79078 RepID=A0ABU6Y1C1_9FABA|nr:hypothetical protein [Stylosanthes scabra]